MILVNRIRILIKRLFSRKEIPSNEIKRFTPFRSKFLGKHLYIHDIDSFNLGVSEIFKMETYKFSAKRVDPFIIDCGANIGLGVIYFKTLYPESRILAFEADDYISGFLEKNIKSFKLKDVELKKKAVFNCESEISFLEEGGAGGRIEKDDGLNSYKKVQTISLRPFLINTNVDFLKIDIEGAEYDVLKDCSDLLVNVDNLFVEYHSFPSQEQKLQEILEIVRSAGFRYHIKEAYTTQNPFLKRNLNVGMDLQLNIFCFREQDKKEQ